MSAVSVDREGGTAASIAKDTEAVCAAGGLTFSATSASAINGLAGGELALRPGVERHRYLRDRPEYTILICGRFEAVDISDSDRRDELF